MDVSLTPELERAVQAKVESGMYSDASDVLREAMRCLLLRERVENGFFGGEPWTLEHLSAAVAVGAEQLEAGIFSKENILDIAERMKKTHPDVL